MKDIKPCQKPCGQCPYTRTAWPGYFGGNPIENYELPIHHDVETPCHKTMGTGKEHLCVGLIYVRVNSAKRAAYSESLILAEKTVRENTDEEVRSVCFSNAMEFRKHHEQTARQFIAKSKRVFKDLNEDRGCSSCKHYESKIDFDHPIAPGSPSKMIRKCLKNNQAEMLDWWEENGNVKSGNPYKFNMSCHEYHETRKILDSAVKKTEELLNMIEESSNKEKDE